MTWHLGEADTNNSAKLSWSIYAKKAEQINDYLFIDTYKSSKIKICMNEMS